MFNNLETVPRTVSTQAEKAVFEVKTESPACAGRETKMYCKWCRKHTPHKEAKK